MKRIPLDLVVFVLGLMLFAGGLSLAWAPLGPIGAGVVLMGVSAFGPRRESEPSE